ncbi:MAG: tripartite tricarboxylate transporter substrate binding protein [Betaproteobacteria bacterium]|nr:tripartite tricarboxylate transporter substrate binding protein [Betaproteobacteria bacterium]
MPHHPFIRGIAGAVTFAAAASGVAADYPSKPIRMLVGFTAGGSTDILSRQIAQGLGLSLQQQVIIDNRSGATGNVASEITARANPDGYTLMMATVATHAINPAIFSKLPFDPIKDFAAVSLIAQYPLLLASHPNVAAKSVRELIDLARAKPGAIRYSSSGSGSPGHLAAEIFRGASKTDMLHVPYKGGSPAVAAVIAGETQINFGTLPGMMPHAKANRLRALAVTTAARSPAMADVPTIAEAGLPGYDVSSWAGVVAPNGTPKVIIAKLQREILDVLKQPAMNARLASEGAPPIGSTPEEFTKFMRNELAKWAAAVKQAGARVD